MSDQIAEIQDYAVAHGLVIAKIYADAGISGATDDRPEFQAMIAACRQDPLPVQGVLVWHLNRIGRDELDRQFYLADLRRRGLAVVSISQRALLESPMAGPMEAMLAWHDQQFLKDLQADVKRGLERAGSLRNHGHKAPPGYLRTVVNVGTHRNGSPRNVQRWVVDPGVAEKVKTAFVMYAQGATYREIHSAVALQSTTYGYWAMFQNPVYTGVVKVGNFRRQDEGLRIISDELFEAAQRRRKTLVSPRSQGSEYLLSGLVRCGICGKAMTGGTNKSRKDREAHPHLVCNHYYRCSKHGSHMSEVRCQPLMRADVLDQRVLEKVYAHLSDESIDAIVGELEKRSSASQTTAELERTDVAIATAKKGIANLVNLAKIGGLGGEEVLKQIKELESEIAALTIKRVRLLGAKRSAPDPQRVRAALEAARDDLHSDEVNIMRRALRSIVDRILVTPECVEIIYREDIFAIN